MRITSMLISMVALLFIAASCGGGGGSDGGSHPTITAPGSPTNIVVNAGDRSISMGWAPPADNGGASITGYNIEITPSVAAGDIHIAGTRAMIGNLTNGETYEISITATNSAGTGPASTAVSAIAQAAVQGNYPAISISDDPTSLGGVLGTSGIYDPSLLRSSDGDLWLSYSRVHYYNNGDGNLVQDVGIRIAQSADNGLTFNWVATVASPAPATVIDSDPDRGVCESPSCTGRWSYETSWLVEDASDPDPNRRFKLFAHKYFLYPNNEGTSATQYHLGAIVMWTAPAPDATWSSETVLLGWPRTSPSMSPLIDVTTLSPELSNCFLVAEGGVAISDNGMDMVFACPYFDTPSSSFLQKIVLLRSTDHAASFQYVSTLLTPDDAPNDVDYFSAPALIVGDDAAQVLLVTRIMNGFYRGSMVFPFAEDNSELFRIGGNATHILTVPVQTNGIHIGGASTYARNTGNMGILQSDATIGATLLATQFNIIRTRAMAAQ